MNARRIAGGLTVAAAALTGPAGAATPESGSISKASPKVEWTGETIGSYFTRVPTAVTADDTVPCQAPSCDTFALNVAESADLAIAADIQQPADNPGSVTVRVRQPDGSVVVGSSDASVVSEGKPYKMTIKKAPVGDYTVEYWNNFYDGPIAYVASAQLAVPPAPASAPAPAPAPAPSQPAPTEAISLKVSGAKAKGRLATAKVTVSRPVKAVAATLKKGSKTVGTGRRGATSGTVTVKVKAKKKLRKGTYRLKVTVTDGSTSTAKTVRVKVKK